MHILRYLFKGPLDIVNIENRSGVYVIICNSKVIDVGESKEIKTRLEDHDRKDCWKKLCIEIHYYVHYTINAQKSGRMEIEQEIREFYKPPCGE